MHPTRSDKLHKLLTVEAVEIAKEFEGNPVDKYIKERLPIIYCDCGAEILLLPDLQAMNRAIRTHVTEHKKRSINKSNVITYSNISQLLSQLSLRKINEQNDT
jgi:hypothetical protein